MQVTLFCVDICNLEMNLNNSGKGYIQRNKCQLLQLTQERDGQ